MDIQACIFDLDGVIVDSAKYHYLSWKRLADGLGVAFSEAQNEQLKGVSRVDSLDRILEWGGASKTEEEKQALMDQKNAWYLEFIDTMERDEILPGVEALLVELQSKNMGVALGSSSKNARRILKQLNLTQLFDVIVDGTDVTRSKPDPEVFLKGAKSLGLPPEKCLVFEDAFAGVQAAQTGGFQVIGIGSSTELHNAPRVIPSFQDFSVADF